MPLLTCHHALSSFVIINISPLLLFSSFRCRRHDDAYHLSSSISLSGHCCSRLFRVATLVLHSPLSPSLLFTCHWLPSSFLQVHISVLYTPCYAIVWLVTVYAPCRSSRQLLPRHEYYHRRHVAQFTLTAIAPSFYSTPGSRLPTTLNTTITTVAFVAIICRH